MPSDTGFVGGTRCGFHEWGIVAGANGRREGEKIWMEKDLLKHEVSCPWKGFWAERGEWRTGQARGARPSFGAGEGGRAGGPVLILLNHSPAHLMDTPEKRCFSQDPPCPPWVLGWWSSWNYHRCVSLMSGLGLGVFASSPSLLFISAESHLT